MPKVDVYLEEVPSANGLWAEQGSTLGGRLYNNLLPTTLAKTKQLGASIFHLR